MYVNQNQYDKLNQIVRLVNDSDISSIRSIVSGIIKIINDPNSTANDLKDIIEIDAPLTSKLLKTANSAFYYRGYQVSDIKQAIIWIGYDSVKELALSQKVCDIFKRKLSIDGYSRACLWKHCLAVALFSKLIYRREFGKKGDNIYAAGLLHDIGIIAEDQFLNKDFSRFVMASKEGNKPLCDVEKEIFNLTHEDIGESIARNWNLPEEIVIALGFHHNYQKMPGRFAKTVMTLHIADCFCQDNGFGFIEGYSINSGSFEECLSSLHIKPHALDLIFKDVHQEIQRYTNSGILP
jgi:putative nucleotidyltransferase with HDIG domain